MPHSPPGARAYGLLWKAWQVLKVIQARLRFFVILAAIGAVIGFWDTLNSYYERWTRPPRPAEEAASDTEYFCPMHPTVVRSDPREKCPICHMDLAKRRKGAGDPAPLAAGTVSRVQLTPYRVVLAGVRTAPVRYRSLAKSITTFGSVEFNETKLAHLAARQKGRIVKLFANFTGQKVQRGEKLAILDVRYSSDLMVTLEDLRRARQGRDAEGERLARKRLLLWDVGEDQVQEFLRTGKVRTEMTITAPMDGHVTRKYQREGSFVEDGTPLYDVADLDSVWIEAQVYEVDQALLQPGQRVKATAPALPERVFDGTLDFVYPHLDENSRSLTVRFHIPNRGHELRPGMYATVRIDVPPSQIGSLSAPPARGWMNERLLDAVAHALASPAGPGAETGLTPLLHAAERMALLHAGQVLAVPDSAVIDTGNRAIVYREASPGVYEGVAVRLGSRLRDADDTAAWYPVLAGLEEGEKVVINGAFLIDAETRLNPAAGSLYFGGSSGMPSSSSVAVRPSTPADEDSDAMKVRTELARLGADDRRLAEAQAFCPIQTETRLGAMGPPFPVSIRGQRVFLCCKGCQREALAHPEETLMKVKELKSRPASTHHHHGAEGHR